MDLRERLRAARLYLVLDGSAPEGLLDAALRGGVDIVQLHDKRRAIFATPTIRKLQRACSRRLFA